MEDVEEGSLSQTEKTKQYLAGVTVFFGGLCTGTILSWTSPSLPQLLDEKLITPDQEGIVASMLALGALVAAIPGGYLADKIGRKKALLYLTLPFMMNWILIIFANGPYMLYAARFFGGIACGANAVCALMYIGEIAEPSIRGILNCFSQIFCCSGILLTTVLGAYLNWRWMSVILGSLPIAYGICMFFIPETPSYLLSVDKVEKARRVLKYLRGENYKYIEVEMNEINDLLKDSTKEVDLKASLSSRANKKALFIALCMMMFQQISGINAVTFYTVSIFQSSGSTLSPDLAAIIVNTVKLLSTLLPFFLIEKLDRKFYLKVSSIGTAICLAALGMHFHFKIVGIYAYGLEVLPLVSLVMVIIMFSIGLAPIPWMMVSELFAPEIKAIGSGCSLIVTWISIFIVTFTFPLVTNHFGGHVIFYMYASVLVLATIFVHFCVPETRGKTLREIQEILRQ